MENKTASDVIEKALQSVLPEVEDADDRDILVDWIVVAYVVNPERSKGSAYPMLFANGEMPTHTARGLLHTGLMYLDRGTYTDSDEEEDE